MTMTATMYAALPPMVLPDATSWALPDTHSVGAFWNVATRRWDVLELGHGFESEPVASYPEDERVAAERHAHGVWRALLELVA
jgi:hypothetical protein